MKNFDAFLKAVREDNEFFVSLADIDDAKVQRGDIGGFLSIAKARKRFQNPISPNQADYVNWVLYDEVSYAASATVPQLQKLFVAPIGSGTKTKVNTNLEQVSSLPAPQWFNTTGISIYFYPNTAPIDLDNYLSTEYMEFWVSQKVYVEGPLDCFPSSGGLFNQSAMCTLTSATTSYLTNTTNGWPSIHNMYDLRLPAGLQLGSNASGQSVTADGIIGVTILQSQTFNVQLKADGGGATMAANNATPIAGVGLTVACRLSGILSRGVQ
jgi:hypothetical protein